MRALYSCFNALCQYCNSSQLVSFRSGLCSGILRTLHASRYFLQIRQKMTFCSGANFQTVHAVFWAATSQAGAGGGGGWEPGQVQAVVHNRQVVSLHLSQLFRTFTAHNALIFLDPCFHLKIQDYWQKSEHQWPSYILSMIWWRRLYCMCEKWVPSLWKTESTGREMIGSTVQASSTQRWSRNLFSLLPKTTLWVQSVARTHLLIIAVSKYLGHSLASLLLPFIRCWCAVHLLWSTSPASLTWISWATASIRDSPTKRCEIASGTIKHFNRRWEFSGIELPEQLFVVWVENILFH